MARVDTGVGLAILAGISSLNDLSGDCDIWCMEVPRHWRLKKHRYRLGEGVEFPCGHIFVVNRPVCLHCDGKPLVFNLGDNGKGAQVEEGDGWEVVQPDEVRAVGVLAMASD